MDVNKKLERYIELSKLFQKSENEIFGKSLESYAANSIDLSSLTVSTGSYISTSSESKLEKTRSEIIMHEAREKAELADQYDEYIELQKNLTEYFKIINKLENE